MGRTIVRMISPFFLCCVLILSVPCRFAFASQPSPPTSQETVSNRTETAKNRQRIKAPGRSTSNYRKTGPELESQMEMEAEDVKSETEDQSFVSAEVESMPLAPETKHDERESTDAEDSITLIDTESAIDADGNVTMTVNSADTLVLPVTMMMKSSDGTLSMTVNRNGQQIKIRPDTYIVIKAVDGNGKKLPSGAELTIPKEGGVIFLDFNKPDSGGNAIAEFIKANSLFLIIAVILALAYRKYVHS